MLLIYDKANNRFKEVHTNEVMTIETVNTIMKKPQAPKYKRVFAGKIFQEVEEAEKIQDADLIEEASQVELDEYQVSEVPNDTLQQTDTKFSQETAPKTKEADSDICTQIKTISEVRKMIG